MEAPTATMAFIGPAALEAQELGAQLPSRPRTAAHAP
jgi:hypothetical protein